MDSRNQESRQSLHTLGIGYIYTYLSNQGFTIYEVHTDPGHHFQILAKKDNGFILVAVRTAYHPDVGIIDEVAHDHLIRESNEIGATPYFAGLSVIPGEKSSIDLEGPTDGREYQITFKGLALVGEFELT